MNLFLVFPLILLGISVELFADSCFYNCNASKYFISDECTECVERKIPFSKVSNLTESTAEDYDRCVPKEFRNLTTVESGFCFCFNTTCVANVTKVTTTSSSMTTAATSLSSSTTATQPCSSETCLNGGNCTSLGLVNYTCNCSEGFHGIHCEFKSVCSSNPCLNNGSCEVDSKNSSAWTCSCTGRFNGTTCEIDKCSNCSADEYCQYNEITGVVQCTNASKFLSTTTKIYLTSTSITTTEATDTNTATTEATDTNTSTTTTTEATDTATTSITTPKEPATTTSSDMNATSHNDTTIMADVTSQYNVSTNTTEASAEGREHDRIALIIGLAVGIPCFVLLIAAIAGLTIYLKKSRATSGKYEPSREEKEGTNMYHNILALPPEEKLI